MKADIISNLGHDAHRGRQCTALHCLSERHFSLLLQCRSLFLLWECSCFTTYVIVKSRNRTSLHVPRGVVWHFFSGLALVALFCTVRSSVEPIPDMEGRLGTSETKVLQRILLLAHSSQGSSSRTRASLDLLTIKSCNHKTINVDWSSPASHGIIKGLKMARYTPQISDLAPFS
jgi:hypothetical protein